MNELQTIIEQAWEQRAELNPGSAPSSCLFAPRAIQPDA